MHPHLEFPGILFHHTHQARRAAIQSTLAAHGLGDLGSPMILLLLVRREEGGGFSQRALADALHVSPATIAVSLKSLVRSGYVEKQEDPEDGRRNLISITPKGRAVVEICFHVFQTVDQAMFAGFSREEVDTLSRLHRKMLDNLHDRFPRREGCPPLRKDDVATC